MARIRTLKPEIWMSPQVINLSHGARLLFIGLITQADDDGRGTADARRLKASIFGGDEISLSKVRKWLDEVCGQKLAIVYQANGHGLIYQLVGWRSHQRIDRPTPSNYPAAPMESLDEHSTNQKRPIVDHSANKRRALDDHSSGILGSDLGSEGSDRTPERAREGLDEDQQGFERVKAAYPKFAGNQSDWLLAERNCQRQLELGATWSELEAASHRFAEFVASGGRSGPQFVNSPSKFFADRATWCQAWTPIIGKAERRLESNLTAAEEFMLRTENG